MSLNSSGQSAPLFKIKSGAIDPLRLFSALSEQGRAPHAFLLESADIHTHTAERSLGCADPCLRLMCRGPDWEMAALNRTGEKVLKAVRPKLGFTVKVEVEEGEAGPRKLRGKLPEFSVCLEERARLRQPGPMDLLRAIKERFPVREDQGFPPGGLFGAFAYDLVDCFEKLPVEQEDPLSVPDLAFYLADHFFLIDHVHDRLTFVATALDVDEPEEEHHRAQALIREYEEKASTAPPLDPLPPSSLLEADQVKTDLDDGEYAQVVTRLKEHILAGDVFQIVPSRSFKAPLQETPMTVYRRLKALNPSPYMFYFRWRETTLLGASPETALKVRARDRKVQIRPIAGTRPRGLVAGKLDQDLDTRYEAELKLDAKELAEHVMLVDLARNDVARVSEPGTRQVERLFTVEKYSHVQHLVSHVSGILRADLDPLHAYLATMNMGTLTGAPKVEAMALLRKTERTRRGFYGGAIGYYMLDGEFDTAIVIRSLVLQGEWAWARAGAGVVYDSVPELEALETLNKAGAPLAGLGYRKPGS